MTRYKVKDFSIEGYRTGSQLRGRENEYIYKIYWNGKDLGKQFATKRHAQDFVSKFVKKVNELMDQYERRMER